MLSPSLKKNSNSGCAFVNKNPPDAITSRILSGIPERIERSVIFILISEYLNTSLNGTNISNSLDFAKVLLEEERVAVIPGAGFGLDSYIRLSYATSKEIIGKGIDRISDFLNKLK